MFTIESTQHIELVVLTIVNNTCRIRKVFYHFLIIFLGFGTTAHRSASIMPSHEMYFVPTSAQLG